MFISITLKKRFNAHIPMNFRFRPPYTTPQSILIKINEKTSLRFYSYTQTPPVSKSGPVVFGLLQEMLEIICTEISIFLMLSLQVAFILLFYINSLLS